MKLAAGPTPIKLPHLGWIGGLTHAQGVAPIPVSTLSSSLLVELRRKCGLPWSERENHLVTT